MKPVVHFNGEAFFRPYEVIGSGETGEIAYVYAVDHPRLGRDNVTTSKVIKKFDDGSFETLNTLYVPSKD